MAYCRKVFKTIVSKKRFELTIWTDLDTAETIKATLANVPDSAKLIDVYWKDEEQNKYTLIFDTEEIVKVDDEFGNQEKQESK